MLREGIVLFFFIAIPVCLVVLHVFLSYRKNPRFGLLIPVIWAIMSIFIVRAGTGEAYLEMTIFCAGIDLILLLIWGVERVIRAKKDMKKRRST